jgi:hypothetical protein
MSERDSRVQIPRRTPRRAFLRALSIGAASPLALAPLVGCDATMEDDAAPADAPGPQSPLARELAAEFAYLDIAPATFERFSRDFERAYGRWRPGQENRPGARFLASTDFFQNGADESRRLRYVRFYDPYLSPCYNPFSGGSGSQS